MRIYRGLAYKEWIKIRWFLLLISAVSLWTLADLHLAVRELFEFMEPVRVWDAAVQRRILVYSVIKYNALAAGAGLALVQFLPETLKRRLRLLFHLPVSHDRSLLFMLGIGAAGVLGVVLLNACGMLVVLARRYPAEFLRSALITAAPWFLAGFAAYFGTVLAVVEPRWRRRILYAALVFALAALLYQGRGYDTYAETLPCYVLLAALCPLAPFLPAFRFKRGLD